VRIQTIQLKNFRCFSDVTLKIDHPVVIIKGANGTGKTSLLEALHYLCYLRSFRTHSPRELMSFESDAFFIKVQLADSLGTPTDIQAGFSGKKRLVKIDQKSVQSFKELMQFYRIVTITEDDLHLIKGGPDIRRAFVDQAMVLFDPEVAVSLRSFKAIAENRNALLVRGIQSESLDVWTQQLWKQSRIIQLKRREFLAKLEHKVNELLSSHFDQQKSVSIELHYSSKNIEPEDSFDEFQQKSLALFENELRMRRSLFGAHLDDFTIIFCHKKSKAYASRGQQKLVAVLLKIAQMQELVNVVGPAIFLLDDFLTDFDENTVKTLLTLLISLENQLIFTSPVEGGILDHELTKLGAQTIKLTH
jgi:DNA replication and repair protein RecF